MQKMIRDLTEQERENICNTRREQNTTSKPNNACHDCPLRFAFWCLPCFDAAHDTEYKKLIAFIGDNSVEVQRVKTMR